MTNIPETNGKVGILGISYDGFLPLMALVNPHPALKVAVPMNPMVDGWMGDDWFHYGAFRQQNMAYIYNQAGTRANTETFRAGCGLTSAIKGRKPSYEMPRMPTLPLVSDTFLISQSIVS